jgi:uncharacterized protein (UPF0332 family)
MTGDDFIQVASKWAASAADEPTWRSSTSRAYYGAFHRARSFLEDNLGITERFRGKDSHSKIWNALIASGEPEAKEAGEKLSRLINRRHDADYDLDNLDIGKQKAAQYSVLAADEIRSHIKKAIENCKNTTVLNDAKSRVQAIIGRFR